MMIQKNKKMKVVNIIGGGLLMIICVCGLPSVSARHCEAWLVQSIPTDMPDLHLVPGVLSTSDVFQWLAGNTSHKLEIMSQYWQLLAHPDDPRSGEYGYSPEEMQSFGADQGLNVYKALESLANRNVTIRILQHSGVFPDYTSETDQLAASRHNVKPRTLLLEKWWGSGIIHANVWVSDHRHLYIGSANNDWKSMTQVKELGVYLVNCPKIARKVETYRDNLWELTTMDASSSTVNIWDQQWQVNRKVPCWSHFIDSEKRCSMSLPRYVDIPHVTGYPILSDPHMFRIPLTLGGEQQQSNSYPPQIPTTFSYLSFSPPEVLFDKMATDEQAWIETIKSVSSGGTVRISTMEWLGQSQYAQQTVYWSSISSAISEVVFAKQAKVKILVSYWAHMIINTDAYLKSLLYSNILCYSSQYNNCAGKVEIRYYKVPGYDETGPAQLTPKANNRTRNNYPAYSRVNHAKFAVSDVRAHIGSSDLVWDYFYTTAGLSFGTYNPSFVAKLQQIFDADWDSPYAQHSFPLDHQNHLFF